MQRRSYATMKDEGAAMSHPPASVVTDVTSHIALPDADWEVATWPPRTPRPRPAPRPFDRAGCLAHLRRVVATQSPYTMADWSRFPLADTLSREEAHFWLLAMTDPARDPRQSTILTDLE